MMGDKKKDVKSKIAFELVNKHYVKVLLLGKEVGSFWSDLGEKSSLRFPYPHDEKQIDSVQLCGFDTCSAIWGCGRYEGKKDLVLTFEDKVSSEYWAEKEKDYAEYLKDHLNFGDIKKVQSFNDFVRHNIGQFNGKLRRRNNI